MEAQRFDRLSKAFAGRSSRRDAVAGLGLAGLLGLLLPGRGARAQEQAKTCRYDFQAVILLGPSSERRRTSLINGELELTIGADGAIDTATLTEDDGTTSDVVGQATGRALNLRIAFAEGEAIVAVGTGERPVSDCRGDLSGQLNGPQRGDLGDWVATAKRRGSAGTPTAVATTTTGNTTTAGQTPASGDTGGAGSCDLECGADTLGLDPAACTCGCPAGLLLCVAEVGSIPAKGGVIFKANPVTVPTGFCIDPATDLSNCGACGNNCPGNERTGAATCAGGVCAYECASGYDNCTGDSTQLCPTDLMSDNANCGACGNACTGGYGCNNGLCQCLIACLPPADLDPSTCSCVCGGGLTACGSTCVDTNSEKNNCGGCGAACRPFEQCQGGSCQAVASQ